MEGSTDFLVGINRISFNCALGRKSCQKVVRMRLQICGISIIQWFSSIIQWYFFYYVPWQSGSRCSVFSCRVALARIVPVPRMDREELHDRFSRVLQASPKDCALCLSSIWIRIRRFESSPCTIQVAPWLRVRQRFDARASLHDLASFHGSNIHTISFCQFAPSDRRSPSRFRKCNDTNRASCSTYLYPHRVIVSAYKRSLSKQLRLIRRLLIAQLLIAIRDPSIQIRSIGERWRFVSFVERVIFRFLV